MSWYENALENHQDGRCSGNCSFCKLERGDITQKEFDELWKEA